MAQQFERVQRGDLISAAGFNEVLTALENLDARVLSLESGTHGDQLTIIRLNPTLSFYRVGNPVSVIGTNFEYTQGNARVFVGTSQVLSFGANSSNTQLDFIIPPVPGVQETGTPVNLRVTNSTEEAIYPIILRPAEQVLFGDVDIDYLAVDPTTILENQQATFQYRITSRASDDAEFLIDPIIGVATNQSIWQSRLDVLDAAFNQIPSRLISLAQLQQKLFHVRIAPVPSGTDGTDFTLTVNASSGGVNGTSGTRSFQVGQPAPVQDNTITINPQRVISGSGTLVGDILTVPAGQSARLRFRVTFSRDPGTGDPDRYDLTLPITPATGSGWTVSPFVTTSTYYEIKQGDINPATGVAERFPEFTISPEASGANASARVDVTYQEKDESANKIFPLTLSLG